MRDARNRLAIFLHAGEYDRMHQGLSIAASGAASGRDVDVFFFWWALDRLVRDDLDAPTFGPGNEELAQDFEERGFPTLRQLLEACRATGTVRLYACSGSLAIIGRHAGNVRDKVDELIGWSTILDMTAGVSDRFYL
ncbi:MAG: hypothetical protein ACK4N5_19615 [Myxococcales bacterium]